MLKQCVQCSGDYDLELSSQQLGALREISYDPKLVSDSRDDRFCSKWCEKEWFDKNYTPDEEEGTVNLIIPKTVFSPSVGKHFSSRRKLKAAMKEAGVVDSRGLESPLSTMERDKTMVSMIRNGKASDPGLKREAAAIQREHEDTRKRTIRQNDQKELYQMKKDRGLLPEQLRARFKGQ